MEKREIKSLKDMTPDGGLTWRFGEPCAGSAAQEIQRRIKSRAQNFLNEIEALEWQYRQDMLELHRALIEAENREKQ